MITYCSFPGLGAVCPAPEMLSDGEVMMAVRPLLTPQSGRQNEWGSIGRKHLGQILLLHS
jgi:hypothetical protein